MSLEGKQIGFIGGGAMAEALIGGLVTDLGSAVSHGAVIAREYGLPAIVNTRTATRAIQTGDRVRLDADRGIVTIL